MKDMHRIQEGNRPIPWEVDGSKLCDGYVAGFLDGDGSLVATVDHRPERRRFPYRILLRINFTQHIRHRGLLLKIKEFLGNPGSLRDVLTHNLAELVIRDRQQIKATLQRLLPYIVLKERQAKIMLAIIAVYDAAKVNVRSSLSEKEFQQIFSMVREVRSLNYRTGGKKQLESFNPVTTSPMIGGSRKM